MDYLVTSASSSFPAPNAKAHFLDDGRTCVLPVKLEPGKPLVIWLNHLQFQNVVDTQGIRQSRIW